ncbi:PAS domain-containing hybrid sensor histidine kinase/response regulator [Novosphingobium lentum]|uniref:PAS domain-containing hybrid sensor histidine kinase/response regulator n=1 Tax=Novosphingobium lentum TaxID=145287 RepID=UPI00082A0B63|nr:PAS domain-containing hybrid sensor histidine kinase/response regulator [Novosphingobium lentum]
MDNGDFQHMLDRLPDVVFGTDRLGTITFINAAWEALTGMPTAEVGTRWRELLSPGAIVELEATATDARNAIGVPVSATLPITTLTGQPKFVELRLQANRDPDGTAGGFSGTIRDRTVELERDALITATDDRFRRIAESAPIGVYQADAEGNIIYVNGTLGRQLGGVSDLALGQGWKDLVDDPEQLAETPVWQGFTPQNDTRIRLIRFRAPDGEPVLMQSVNRAEFRADGSLRGFIGVMTDVTRQFEATQALEISERRYATLTELAPVGIFRTDTQGKVTFANAAWAASAGISPQEALGDGWARNLHPDDRQRVLDGWSDAWHAQTGATIRFRWLHPDGQIRMVDVVTAPEASADGEIVSHVGSTVDITDRVKAEASLKERESQLALLAEYSNDAIFRLNLEGICIYASPATRDVVGFSPKAIIGSTLLDHFHPDDQERVRHEFQRLARGEMNSWTIEYRQLRPPELIESVWLEASCRLVRDDADRPIEIIATVRLIDQRKQLERDLHAAKEAAEDAARAKSTFLANMSHEIRTPMNGVLGFADVLLAGSLQPDQRRKIELIAESGRGMMRLLNDALELSSIESGLLNLTIEDVNLALLVDSSMSLLRSGLADKPVELRLDLDPALPRAILGDGQRMRQIVDNLIGNAIKFTDQGTIVIAAKVLDEQRSRLRITVTDTGIGIAKDAQERIFEGFTQANSGIHRRFGGTGLGLSISRELATAMGGSLTVASTPGTGSAFMLDLPLIAAPSAGGSTRTPRHASQPAELPRFSGRALVAEDSKVNRFLVAAMLDRLGMAHDEVGDGQAAVDLALQRHRAGEGYDVVLMDLQMPVLDGIEATAMIRKAGLGADDLPIVALSAQTFPDVIDRCTAAGMQAHLSKPLTLAKLAGILRDVSINEKSVH